MHRVFCRAARICRLPAIAIGLILCLSACSLVPSSPEWFQTQHWLREHLAACIEIAAIVLLFIGLLFEEDGRLPTPLANYELIYAAWRLEIVRHAGLRFSAVMSEFGRMAFVRRAARVYVQFVREHSREPSVEELRSLAAAAVIHGTGPALMNHNAGTRLWSNADVKPGRG